VYLPCAPRARSHRFPIAGLVLLAACLPGALLAQRYSFKHYGQEAGLGNLVVQCLLQDRAGFLWVGTQNGLYRYDGWRFQSYDRDDGLPSTRIESLHESPNGVLWVGTRAGLARRAGDRFQAVRVAGEYQITSSTAITSDKRGWIYVGTTAGLLTGRPTAAKAELDWRFEWLGARTGTIYALHLEPGGQALWLGCDGKLYRLAGGNLTAFGPEAGVPVDRWDAILTDPEGNLWLRSTDRLVVRRKGASQFTPADAGLPGANDRGSLQLDSEGRLLVATGAGVALRDRDRWERIDSSRGLVGDQATCVLQDREGSIWIGLDGAGLERWLGYRQWESWTRAEGLSNDDIWSIQRDPSGALWVGTARGLNYRSQPGGAWRLWPASRQIGATKIRKLVADRNGILWVGSDPGGVASLNPREQSVRQFGEECGLADDRVLALLVDRRGQVWAGTRRGLYRGTGTSWALRFEREWPQGTDENERFSTLLEDRQGRIWAGGNHGLARLEGGRWTRFTSRDGLKDNGIYLLAEARDGSLWIGYSEALGITRVAFPEGRLALQHFDRRNGLRSDKAISLAVDTRGRVWFGSDSGVDVFDGRSWQHLGRGDGLVWDDINGGAMYADQDGSVWIGTSLGLAHFRPPERELPPAAPPIEITSVRFGERLVDPALPLRIPYRDRSLLVNFAALSFLNEGEVRFRSRLADSQMEWMETRQREAQYPGLAAGEYAFEVMARSAQGVWSRAPARMSFRILAPWWQTAWFRVLAGALAALLGWRVWRLRMRHLLEQQQRLEAAVAERTSELSAEHARTEQEKLTVEKQNQEIQVLLEEAREGSRLKSAFLANVSHEIRTPMNGILGMQTLALATELSPEQREYIETAHSSAEALLGLLNDVLDFSKIEAGRLELDPVDFSLSDMIRSAVNTMSARAGQMNLHLKIEIAPKTPDALWGDAVRLRQVLLNLVGNAIKFTEAGGQVGIGVGIDSEADRELVLRFSVSDTGIGIPADKQELIFEEFRQVDSSTTRKYGGTGLGLGISSRLVGLMGGRIWVESEPGHGSTFRFTARLRRAVEAPEPASSQAAGLPALLGSLAAGGRRLRVLLAEDNPVNQRFASRLIEKLGHQAAVVSNGREALAASERDTYDLVLMDVQMPEMDGIEATRLIRLREGRSGGHLPIVAMTAYAMRGDREKCLDAGMDGYVAKPIQLNELLDAIQVALSTAQVGQPAAGAETAPLEARPGQAQTSLGGPRRTT
jgi:signal transduction histidine kinase/ligand-binding sensor domain-containing protein/DNA-binding NarL/FixJ family response regulator